MMNMPKVNVPALPVLGHVCDCPEPHRMPDANAEEVDAYFRVSEDKRIGGVEELAVERQRWTVCRMCGERNWKIVRVWVDNDKSATSGVYRPAFEGTLVHPDTKVIVTWHTDRYVRLRKQLERVIEKGLLVHAAKAGSHDLSNPTGIATAMTVTTWAQHEGELKALRQKEQNRQVAVNGAPRWWNRTPFGFNPDTSHHATQAPALRKVYENLLLGASMGSQVRWLNEKGLISNTGAQWKYGSLRHVLMAPRNAGIRTYTTTLNKGTPREQQVVEEFKGTWQPIVTEETYRAVVHLLQDPSRFSGGPRNGKQAKYLITGIAVCGNCGAGIHAHKVTGQRRSGSVEYRYYTCRTPSRCCNHDMDFVDSYVLRKAIEKLGEDDFRRVWDIEDTDTQPAIIEKARLTENIKLLGEQFALDKIPLEAMIAGTEKAKARIKEIDTLLVQAGSSAPVAALMADRELLWQQMEDGSLDLERQRQLLMAVFSEIKLLPRKRSREMRGDMIVLVPRTP
jgi:DNA invertase Pin-like site-specific DNA recombinase